eukprot:5975370-Pyramimonas_sp.AAC.1
MVSASVPESSSCVAPPNRVATGAFAAGVGEAGACVKGTLGLVTLPGVRHPSPRPLAVPQDPGWGS